MVSEIVRAIVIIIKCLPKSTDRRRCSQRLRNSQWRWVLNPSLLMMWSRKESGVTGCIFHLRVDSTSSSILWIVFASNTYFVSCTWKHNIINKHAWDINLRRTIKKKKNTQMKQRFVMKLPEGLREEALEFLQLLQPKRCKWQPRAGSSKASPFENGSLEGTYPDK